jgi:flagellar biosynthetic protein FlhB
VAEQNDQERTEEATPRRRSEAREKGQVALSQDLVAALSLAAGASAVAFGGARLAEAAGALLRDSTTRLPELGHADLGADGWSGVVLAAIQPLALPALLVIAPLLAVGMLAGYAQVGFQIAPKALEWNAERLSPASGLKRLFGARSAVRTLQSSLKIALVCAAAGWSMWSSLPLLANLAGAPLGAVLAGTGSVLGRVGGAGIATFAGLSLLDTFYQRWQHGRDLRMTRQELREEIKSTEGDPHVRARIREIQRRMARQRMMADVPTATVVVTNPTHVAVALRWEGDEGADGARKPSAPAVVAKGVDLMAQRIKQVAREHGVPLCEDVPLARALHARCEIGEEIPAELYQAVAAVLAQVWKLSPAAPKEA